MAIDPSIRPATDDDYASLGVIGPAAYAAAYHDFWSSPAELARHLATFGEAAIRAFASTEGASIWLAEIEGEAVGFLSMLRGSDDPIHREACGAEIPRIFLLPHARGMGIGRHLMQAAEAEARRQQLAYFWLDAMDTADWAVRTYLAWGFKRIGKTIFPKPVRPERAGMIVFKKRIQAPD